MRKQRILTILTVAFALVISVGLMPSQAHATKSDCSSGFFCIWSSTNYTGGFTIFAPPAIGHPINFVSSYDNNAESAYNHSSVVINIYSSYNCTGSFITVFPGESRSTFGSGFNNTASSICHVN